VPQVRELPLDQADEQLPRLRSREHRLLGVLDREPPGKTVCAEVDVLDWLALAKKASLSAEPTPPAP